MQPPVFAKLASRRLKDEDILNISSKGQKRVAMAIGINKYFDSRIPPLIGSENDAKEISELLKHYGNFNIETKNLLLGSEATASNIRRALSNIFWRPNEYDLAVVYISGHGFIDGYGNGYLAPYDFIVDDPIVCGIGTRELRDILSNSINKRNIILIMDVIYNEVSKDSRGIFPKSEDAYNYNYPNAFVKDIEESNAEGRIILASTQRDRYSKEIPDSEHEQEHRPHPHGIFTLHLLQGLSGQASNDQGIITLPNLYNYVEQQMSGKAAVTPRLVVTGKNEIENITIAIAPEKYISKISTLLEKTKNLLTSKDNVTQVIGAISITNELKNMSDDELTNKLKKQVNEVLESIRERVTDWLYDNIEEIRPRIEAVSPGLYSRLFLLENFLNVDSITLLDDFQFCLLSAVIETIDDASDNTKYLTRKCSTCVRNYSSPWSQLRNRIRT